MSITVLPKPNYKIVNEKLSLEIGAYRWTDYGDVNLNSPKREEPTKNPDNILTYTNFISTLHTPLGAGNANNLVATAATFAAVSFALF